MGEKLTAADTGAPDDEEERVGRGYVTGQGGNAVPGLGHRVPCVAQVHDQQITDVGLVFGNENGFHTWV